MTIRRSLYLSGTIVALLALGGLSAKIVTAGRLEEFVDDRDDPSDDGDSDDPALDDVDMGAKTVKVDAIDGTVLAVDDKDPAQDSD
jgi:hypothetical protein